MTTYQVIHDDCLSSLAEMPDNSVDSIITDPPYGLNFMGKKWDCSVPSVDIWAECLRVLKPGGHLLAFAGTRTQHRMAVNIEDAGFEIRDMIAWVYGSGFPKSHNLTGEYEGWGTALKPALEPITVARKPLVGTVAENVATYGCGAINIRDCRVPLSGDFKSKANGRPSMTGLDDKYEPSNANQQDSQGRWPANLIHDGSDDVLKNFPSSASPWIGNTNKGAKGGTMFGGSEQSIADKPEYRDSGNAARFFYCAKASKHDKDEGLTGFDLKESGVKNGSGRGFSSNDPMRKIMRANHHPTVKPTALMRYLCRLITPRNGVVLDPFMGSGSTGKAAMLEGLSFIGMEKDVESFEIAQARVKHAYHSQTDLFGGAA